MSSLAQQLADAVDQGKIPHAVVFATNRDGSFNYSHAVGKTSAEEHADDIQEDAIFLLASQTKLLTAVAALQLIEQGLISINENVEELLPELAKLPVLRGFDAEDKPILEDRNVPITLWHLLTHTSGAAFDAGDPNLLKYQSQLNTTPNTGPDVLSRFSYPLIFQPGEKWCYGPSIDWAGLFIERLTNSTLEEYMQQHIWKPLGIKTMTFFPHKSKNPDLSAKIPVLSSRGADGKLHPFREPFITTDVTGCFGGQGLYSSMGDYLLFLRSLLASSPNNSNNNDTILSPTSINLLFTPQLTNPQSNSQLSIFLSPVGSLFIGEFDWEKYRHGWAFGGIVFEQSYADGRRRAGSMSWGGAANSFWLMDREAGIALTFGTQVVPPGDKGVKEVITMVERGVYAMVGGVA